jgi:DNA-binding NtrC family response regulator
MNTEQTRKSREIEPAGHIAADAFSPSAADTPSPRSIAQRILIVEDERRLREMLLAYITEMGLEPIGASSAESALKLLEHQSFATALVDLNLPGMSGMDFCQRVRKQWPSIQLIILTGFGDLESAKRAIRLEVVDFLTKPCGMDNLEAALGRARLRWLDRWLATADQRPAPTPPRSHNESAPAPAFFQALPHGVSLDDMERQLIIAALHRHDGSREAAAAELGISVRKLYYRLRQYQQRGLLPQD